VQRSQHSQALQGVVVLSAVDARHSGEIAADVLLERQREVCGSPLMCWRHWRQRTCRSSPT
jgi:hypothetical protein